MCAGFRRLPSPALSLPVSRPSTPSFFESNNSRLYVPGRSPIRRAIHVQSTAKRFQLDAKDSPVTVYRSYSKHPSPRAPDGPEPTYSKLVSGYQIYHHSTPFKLDYGHSLPSFDLAYEVWGKLSDDKDNVILLHTGLSASSHAKSHQENRKSRNVGKIPLATAQAIRSTSTVTL
ncbi:uncharacterized protein PGTG_21476 [Puccinia graminis f. sp. tritici CRL 75-36-700-3]|uniref:Uncharacterized protein n=1 Tax=Puccinia graminis f. sp. tritici (strain CRL 75-36-700-3 / race SCCL) TaxID=418459 RepID=H6QRW0_PUCGT|nr:uncharacterized protein PGTG_21476 [Puccinia graminis f. sp. tritici CRL 75-36-700-3]EHS63402.1 hypothetical protein PGTG_21476 [Puccinia graminis f. sp. tritici CRL 75-36-700-3]